MLTTRSKQRLHQNTYFLELSFSIILQLCTGITGPCEDVCDMLVSRSNLHAHILGLLRCSQQGHCIAMVLMACYNILFFIIRFQNRCETIPFFGEQCYLYGHGTQKEGHPTISYIAAPSAHSLVNQDLQKSFIHLCMVQVFN